MRSHERVPIDAASISRSVSSTPHPYASTGKPGEVLEEDDTDFGVSMALAGTAQAGELRAEPLLAVDMKRAAIDNWIVADGPGALGPGEEEARRETLHALRADRLLAVSAAPSIEDLLGSLNGVDEAGTSDGP